MFQPLLLSTYYCHHLKNTNKHLHPIHIVTMSQCRLNNDVMYIMEHLADDIHQQPDKKGLKLLPKYASVCKAWQAYFEHFTFKSIWLWTTCLDRFGEIIARRQGT